MTGQLFPYRSPEIGAPVAGEDIAVGGADSECIVRGGCGFFQFFQIKILTVFAFRIQACPFEPLVFVGTVIHDQIHDNIHVSLFGLREQAVYVVHCTEAGIDIIVVGDVIALIRQR